MIMILYSTSVEIFQRHKNFLSTGHGAYLTGRSAAQLMIRFISIQTYHNNRHYHNDDHNHYHQHYLYLHHFCSYLHRHLFHHHHNHNAYPYAHNTPTSHHHRHLDFTERWKTRAIMEARRPTTCKTPQFQTSVHGFRRYDDQVVITGMDLGLPVGA